jgi:hypothetical protein
MTVTDTPYVSAGNDQYYFVQVTDPATGEVETSSASSVSVTPGSTITIESTGTTVYGQSATITATILAASPAVGTPTGSVAFTEGSATLGTEPVVSGVATLIISTLGDGSDSVIATYSGDTNFVSSTNTEIQTVAPAPLTITASSNSMTYGGTIPTPAPSYTGFVNGDTAASLTTAPTCTTTGTVESCSGAVDSNYRISYVSGTLTVNPAPLTITASSPIMTYGGTVPTITAIYSGLENGDVAPATPPTCSVAGTVTNAGTYTTTCSGAVDSNYAPITYVSGTLTVITPQTPQTTITLSDGSTANSLGINITSGLSTTANVLGDTFTFTTTNTAVESVNVIIQNVTSSSSASNLGYSDVELLDIQPTSNDITVNVVMPYSCSISPAPTPFISKDNGASWINETANIISSSTATPCYVSFSFNGDPLVGLFTSTAVSPTPTPSTISSSGAVVSTPVPTTVATPTPTVTSSAASNATTPSMPSSATIPTVTTTAPTTTIPAATEPTPASAASAVLPATVGIAIAIAIGLTYANSRRNKK